MEELRALYQELLLDHSREPRHYYALPQATHQAEGYNPLCGDRVTIYVELDHDHLRALSFQGAGCAISTASASLMTESLAGKTRAEAEALFARFQGLVTGKFRATEAEDLGELAVFAGVATFPMRVKCATLAWHALRAALAGEGEGVSTE